MSYESKLDRQSHKLISPVQLCLLLSVALHLLVLRFGLPTIRFNNNGGQREVSVIELTPEQQARLPNLYPQLPPDLSQIDLPQSDSNEPAAPFAIPPNLIPGITDPANLPPLVIPPPPTFDIPALPPVTDITLPPIGDLSDLPLPPQIDPLDFKVEPIELPPNVGKVPEVPTEPEVKNPPKTPTAAKPDIPPEPVEEPKLPPEVKPRPPETPEQIAARKVARSQERIQKLRQSLTKTNNGTSDEEARKNYIVWLAKVQDIEPQQLEVVGTYPRDACIKRLKGSSVFGVVVNAQGEVVALDLIKGAEYSIFNEQASKDISDRTFDNETEKPKPYQVKVNYEYDADICPSLTLPSIMKQEQAPALEPEPEQTPASELEPAPESKTTPTPESEPEQTPTPEPEPEQTPTSEPPSPSLRDRLRNVPLQNLDPSQLKDVPLPDRPDFN